MGEALLILHLLAFPFLRPSKVEYLGGAVVLSAPLGVPGGAAPAPPGKYKIIRKQRLKSTLDNDND